MNKNIVEKLKETLKYIRKRSNAQPKIGIILGSGLGKAIEGIDILKAFSYKDIPHFPTTRVTGHAGRMVFAGINKKPVLIMQGRPHFYEGYSSQQIIYPVRLMKLLGINHLIITAACGAVNRKYRKGDLVVLKDHLNFMGKNPLRGTHFNLFGERFPDMSRVYDKKLRSLALSVSKKLNIRMHQGVYMAVSGPSYETPSEISAFRKLGADLVGMSVVPETIAASQMNMKILGICNVANETGRHNITHNEVIKAGKLVEIKLGKLIKTIIKRIN
ncbi:MAG: purine-nucleoside phosphorylase [Endomicrobiales bacterium]|nr:purine-nucleoside phosphorylase [Endomicrobiales bacterium]